MSTLINMYASDDKDMILRKLTIRDFECRNMLYLMFESLRIYYSIRKG